MKNLLASFALLGALAAGAQQTAPPPQTAVNPDGSITFRYTNASAGAAVVNTDALPKPLPLQKDDKGTWTATTPPLKPEHYGYSFHVDGVDMRDPLNPAIRPNILALSNDILVPGATPQPWEMTPVPHGAVTHVSYTTHVGKNLPENQESYVVYTPPGYDPHRKGGYPTLYLLHGWSDNELGWTAVGQADLILDSLLAANKIVPMVVVMPEGYGDYTFVSGGHTVWNDPAKVDGNVSLYSDMLVEEIMPAVERGFNVAKDREHRAIAGLSMGGLESLTIGLTRHNLFSYVVGMSSAVQDAQFDGHFPALAAGHAASAVNLKLLWVACGVDDGLITPNRAFVAWAKSKELPVTPVETPGQHTWLVWRQNLLTVAPLLFR